MVVEFARARNYDVILEGILTFSRYGAMLRQLVDLCPDHHVYYFDIPFEETLRRHAGKPNALEFGESEMRGWYQLRDVTNFEREKIIDQSWSLERIVSVVMQDAHL